MASSSCAVRSATRASRLSLSALISASARRRSVMSRDVAEDCTTRPSASVMKDVVTSVGTIAPVAARLVHLVDVGHARPRRLDRGDPSAGGPP